MTLKFAMTFARMPFSEIGMHSRTHKIKVEWSEGPGKVDKKKANESALSSIPVLI